MQKLIQLIYEVPNIVLENTPDLVAFHEDLNKAGLIAFTVNKPESLIIISVNSENLNNIKKVIKFARRGRYGAEIQLYYHGSQEISQKAIE